jgi:hypothetical protein
MLDAQTYIGIYLFFGACFGFFTYSQRHLFSEGPRKAIDSDQTSPLDGRFFLDHGLHLPMTDHGHHKNQYCLGAFQAQKAVSKVILIFF